MIQRLLCPLALASVAMASSLYAADKTPAFERIQVTDVFWSEGAHYGDFNKDGKMDICAGPYWYAGPDFKQRNEFTKPPAQNYDGAKSYSDYFLSYCYDFDNDGWTDILVYSWPGKDTSWYRNPQNKGGEWVKSVIFDVTDGESPDFADVTGDGKPEIIAFTGGQLGFAEIDWKNPTAKAKFWPISTTDAKKYQRYYHGYGYGDINGDGKADMLDKEGWFEQPNDFRHSTGPWTQHKFNFVPVGIRGGAQMLCYDVNGDKLNDVITSWDAHGYGLAWYEQVREGAQITFKEHILMNTKETDNPQGVKFTQPHALVIADMNGDGLKDFVTGKRFWAHGPKGDVETDAPTVLYWFELKRSGKTAEFIPHLIDDNSGVGTQITAADLNGDKKLDVISSNKKGVHVFIQKK